MGLFKRNNDFWIDYYVNGKRRREKIGTSKALAETVLKKRKVEIAENKFLDIRREQRIRFNLFADEYIELYAKTNNIAWKRSILPNLKALKRFFGDRLLTEITPHLIEKFKIERIKEVSPAATNRALTLLKSMFNRATEWDKFNASFNSGKTALPANHKDVPANCESTITGRIFFLFIFSFKK